MDARRRIRLAALFSVTVLGVGTGGLLGASGTVRVVSASGPSAQVSEDLHHDTSPPLRSLQSSGTRGHAHPAKHHQPDAAASTNSPDTSQQSATPRIPSTTVNFTGIGANGSAPPDDDGAIGPTQFVELVNTELAVYSKIGAPLLGPIPTNSLFSGFDGGGCQTNNDGDGTIVFDSLAQRWVIQQFSVSAGPYLECIAVSTSTDATGTWNRYSFATGPNFPDYPKLGAWSDGYYVSYNLFNPAGTAGLGTLLCAYDRSQMMVGNPATQQCFNATSQPEKTFLPASIDGSTAPPVGEPEWFVGLSPTTSNALAYYTLHIDFTNSNNSHLSTLTNLGVNAFSLACGGGTCIPQAHTSNRLDSLGDRLMYRLAYRNLGVHEAMVVSHSVTAGSSVGERWYELRPSGGSLSVFQQGTYAPDSNYRWMGSIAMDQAGDMGLGYSVSSGSLRPGLRYTGRLSTDPAGSMPQGEATIFTGAGSQTSGLTRWGDYSEMTVDPVDGCTFWYVNEYLPSNGSFNWATRVGSFKFPGCGGTPTNDFSISANPASVSTAPGGSPTTSINTGVISGGAQSIALSASGQPTGVTVSFVPSSVAAGSSSTMTMATTSSVAPGSYTITVTGNNGTASHTTPVSLTVSAPVSNDFSIKASPSTVTVTQGGTGQTTVSTTQVSGSAETVQLSASGLPTGSSAAFQPASVTSSGGTSTLTITSTASAQTGNATVTITGTAPSATHSTTITLTVNPAGSSSGVVNGGFETGDFTGWSTSGQSETVVTGGHTGSYAARLGSSSPTNGDSIMQQTVSVPAGGASLSFWYQPHCPDTLTYDQEQMQIRSPSNAILATLLNVCSNSGAWTQVTANLTQWAGTSVVLWFNSHDDNYPSDPTYTLFDDIALGAAPPAPGPDVVQNGGFESGNFSSWTTAGQSESVVNTAHTGSFAARLGSTSPTNGDSTMRQTVTVPAAGATLTFWYQPHCPDTLTYDQEQMQVRNTSNAVLLTVLNVCSDSGVWTQASASLNAYAGTSVVLYFNSHDDNYPTDPTYTLFDDVSVQ